MSKEMTDEELLLHCGAAVVEVEQVITGFAKSTVEKMKKRAMLLGYWLKTYARYLRTEDSFSPESVLRLKRGAVVQVEFGYRIGRELGGRHYAVVLDSNNSIHRNTVTVVPLGSKKEGHRYEDDLYTVLLDDGVYEPVYKKLNVLMSEVTRNLEETMKMEVRIKSAPEEEKPGLIASKRHKKALLDDQMAQAKVWLAEFTKMKPGSAARVDQVTTVSKMRISAPLEKTHPLYGVRLSNEDMNKIDERLKKLFSKNTTAQ